MNIRRNGAEHAAVADCTCIGHVRRQAWRAGGLAVALVCATALAVPWAAGTVRAGGEDLRIEPDIEEPVPEPLPPPAVQPAPSAEPRPGRAERPPLRPIREVPGNLGARVGLVMPGDARESAFPPMLSFGGYYRGMLSERDNLALQLGMDMFFPEDEDDLVRATVAVFTAGVLWGDWNQGRAWSGPYVLAGGALFTESTEHLETGVSSRSVRLAVEIGGGYSPFGRGMDCRVVLSVLLGDVNVRSLATVWAGYSF